MEKNKIILFRTKIQDFNVVTNAIAGWLDTNEPVKAYKALLKLDEKIKNVIKELEEEEKK